MKQKILLNIFILGLSVLVLTSCCNYTAKSDFYISEDPVTNVDEQAVAQVTVLKRGFYFLWCIPFKRGCEAFAKDLMEKKVREAYKGKAVGVAEYKIIDEYNMSLFWWTTGTKVTGKVIVKK